VSATSPTSATSATSGTLGDAAPVSFPGIASGIDYNSIIEKYTADTLLQEKPDQAQINNLNAQNTAILKITNLIGAVQDSLTALSNPTLFNAYNAAVSNTASGSPAATATQISGQTPVAGTYIINAQTAATPTSITNNPNANAALNTTVPLAAAGTSISPSNGNAASGTFTVNGVQINYNVTTDSITQIVNAINTALQGTDGGSATLNANGTVTLTGVQTLGSGADSGNLEQVLKIDDAQLTPTTLNPALALDNESLATDPTATAPPITLPSGTAISADVLATPPAASGVIDVNGTGVAWNNGQSLSTILGNITAVTGGTATMTNGQITLSGGTLTSLSDTSGNLTQALDLTGAIAGNSTTSTANIAPASVVVNGIAVGYNPQTQSLNTILANIASQVAGVTGTVTGNKLTLNGLTSLADGAGSNFLEALNLTGPIVAGSTTSTASVENTSSTVTSSSPIAGIDEYSLLGQANNAGFATAVTNGTFTINGVQFTVNTATDSLSDLITDINTSSAGVTASYNQETSSLQLTSNTPGPQSILLGATGDSSNFLTAAGLKTGTTTAGTQASLTFTNAQGAIQTVYSATDSFTNAIPGINLTVNSSSPASLPAGSQFYTVTVASDPTQAEAAINKFITAYNAAIVELNKDTQAPTVSAGTDSTTGVASSSSSGGGVLYGNYQISDLKDQLVSLVSGFIPSGSTSYNSLQSVGVLLDTNSQEVGADSTDSTDSSDSKDSSNSANNNFTVNATSGQLQALDTTTFAAAYAADSSAIANLFTLQPQLTSSQAGAQPVAGATYGFSYLMGSELANVDGLSTFLNNSVVTPADLGSVLLTNLTDSNNQQIDTLQAQISLINQEATQQADSLRAQFTASESQIAELQALQSQIAAIGH
jgi:flagellar hook-associated protein 2